MAEPSPRIPFSQRYGYVTVTEVVQTKDLNHRTRMDLWNLVIYPYVRPWQEWDEPGLTPLGQTLWTEFLGEAIHRRSHMSELQELIYAEVLNSPFHRVFDLLEHLAEQLFDPEYDPFSQDGEQYIDECNRIFAKHLVQFRFVNISIVPTSSNEEVRSIEQAVNRDGSPAWHLRKALGFLSDYSRPDYENSAKESISAVEALLWDITGKKTLGESLNTLKHDSLVPNDIISAWEKIYKWTNVTGGVRHCAKDKLPSVDQAMAMYLLVTSSAFVNFVQARRQDNIWDT